MAHKKQCTSVRIETHAIRSEAKTPRGRADKDDGKEKPKGKANAKGKAEPKASPKAKAKAKARAKAKVRAEAKAKGKASTAKSKGQNEAPVEAQTRSGDAAGGYPNAKAKANAKRNAEPKPVEAKPKSEDAADRLRPREVTLQQVTNVMRSISQADLAWVVWAIISRPLPEGYGSPVAGAAPEETTPACGTPPALDTKPEPTSHHDMQNAEAGGKSNAKKSAPANKKAKTASSGKRQNPGAAAGEKKTFAKRVLPTNDSLASRRFLKVQQVFSEEVAPHVSTTGKTQAGLVKVVVCPGLHGRQRDTHTRQEKFLKECYLEAKELDPEAMKDMEQFENLVRKIAKAFPGWLNDGLSA